MTRDKQIRKILEKRGIDPEKILELNELQDFNDCVISKDNNIRNEKGHMLRGVSGNPTGRSSEEYKEKKEEKERVKNLVATAIDRIKEEYDDYEKDPIMQLAVGVLMEQRTTYDVQDWLKQFMQYFVGKKQSIDSKHEEKREIVVKIGTVETTQICADFSNRLIDVSKNNTKEE